MFVFARKRQKKDKQNTFYIYLCKSSRVEGKVTCKNRYVGKIDDTGLKNRDFTFLEKKKNEFTIKEISIILDKLNAMADRYNT